MLKFISANDSNYEDVLIKEFNIPSIIKINDFIITLEPGAFQTILRISAEKIDIRDPKKADEFYKSKILLLFSLFTNPKYFQDYSSTRKAFNQFLKLIQSVTKENKHAYIDYLEDIYLLIPSVSCDLRSESLLTILDTINNAEDDNLCHDLYNSNKNRLRELLLNFTKLYSNQEENASNLEKVYTSLGRVLHRVRNFDILDNIESVEELLSLLKNSSPVELVRIFFYVLFNRLSIKVYKTNLELLRSVFKNNGVSTLLENENKLMNLSDLAALSDVDVDNLNGVYGDASGENFLVTAKLIIVYETLLTLNKTNFSELSFERLEKEFKLNVEDLEEVLFMADSINLFKLVIDYQRNQVRVRYVRRSQYTKEDLEQMRGRVSGLRERMKGLVKKVDLLIASE